MEGVGGWFSLAPRGERREEAGGRSGSRAGRWDGVVIQPRFTGPLLPPFCLPYSPPPSPSFPHRREEAQPPHILVDPQRLRKRRERARLAGGALAQAARHADRDGRAVDVEIEA